jgi:hypothetical protein
MRRGPDRPGRARYHDRRVGDDPASARLADIADDAAPARVSSAGATDALERIAPAEFEAAESGGGGPPLRTVTVRDRERAATRSKVVDVTGATP